MSDEGYPVDSVIDPDLRALAELRAMGPARLLTLLRRAYDTSPSDLFDLLHQHWGSSAPRSGLGGLAAREAQAEERFRAFDRETSERMEEMRRSGG